MYFHLILITILSPLHTLSLPAGTYHCWHDGVSPRLFTLHESIHILSLILATTTKTVAMYFSFTSMIVSYRVTSFAMRIARVLPFLLHQVLEQYQYLHSATLLMHTGTKHSTNKSTHLENRHYCAYCACAALIRVPQQVL